MLLNVTPLVVLPFLKIPFRPPPPIVILCTVYLSNVLTGAAIKVIFMLAPIRITSSLVHLTWNRTIQRSQSTCINHLDARAQGIILIQQVKVDQAMLKMVRWSCLYFPVTL